MALTRSERAPLVTDAIPPALRRHGIAPRRVFVCCLVGALVLTLFASRDTPGWAERLGDAPFAHRLRSIAGDWDETMEQLGIIRPHETLRDAMQRLLGWHWSENGD